MNVSKIYSSQITFDINNIINYKNTNYKIPFTVSKNIVNILYLGRLMGTNGMDILYLMKLMKKLGKKYKLYIIPGSFVLPINWPVQKKSVSKHYLELKQFVEKYELIWSKQNIRSLPFKYPRINCKSEKNDYDVCNIEV